MQNRRLDKFYTKESVVKVCLSCLDLAQYSWILEPSAGAGAFLDYLPPEKSIGIDLRPEPQRKDIIKMDFFTSRPYSDGTCLVVGNPPFGKNCSLAIKFFNHAACFADKIAFILPRTFRKVSVINCLDDNFHLTKEVVLGDNSFFLPDNNLDYDVPCIFQVWEKREEKRKTIEKKLEHPDFNFLTEDKGYTVGSYEITFRENLVKVEKEDFKLYYKLRKKYPLLFPAEKFKKVKENIHWDIEPDFSLRRCGGSAGQVFDNPKECSTPSHHFIKCNIDNVKETFQNLWENKWNLEADPNKEGAKYDTAGNPSISKDEFIREYEKAKEEK